MRRWVARVANLFRGRAAEREMAREMASHIGLLQEEFEGRGLSPEEARRAAQRAYGGVEQAKELHREARSLVWLEHVVKDVRYGARTLWRTPGFTVVAAITLALGMGANTAIFSVVNAVLLQPLAYHDADRLVTLMHHRFGPVATGNYLDWRDQSHSFAAMGAADYWRPNLTSSYAADNSPAEHIYGLKVTQSLLPTLGVAPMLGRVFATGEDKVGADHEVVLSYRLWVRRFQRDPKVIGRSISLNGEAYAVVGIMPQSFQFAPFWATNAELWAPDAFDGDIHAHSGNHLRVFARLKPGVTMAQAQADIATVTGRLEKQFPGTNRGVTVTPLKQNVVGNIQTPLLLLLGAVGFVLLMACANVAHMLLARTSDRQKEIAVRTALGAGRARVMAQFLTENLMLAMLGAVLGLGLAVAGMKALVAIGPEYIPRVDTIAIDGRVGLFLFVITVITALAFGLVPAMQAAAGNLSDALKEGGRGGSDGIRQGRLRSVLVASEFALAFMLLIGAGLMIRSFVALESVNPGFQPHHVLSMVVSVAGTKEEAGSRRAIFYRELLEKVRQVPGVQAASGINHLPLAGDLWTRNFEIAGRPKPLPTEEPEAVFRIVMPKYFETMRLPVRRGRSVTDRDDEHAPGVVMVNEQAVRQYWRGANPVGQRITMPDGNKAMPWLTVIGVVADAKTGSWAEEARPEIYVPALQNPLFLGESNDPFGAHMNYITLVVRGAGRPEDLADAVKRTVWSFDRNLPISDVITMDRAIADATAQPRFEMLLLGAFGAVALLLAAVGIYGVLSYAVARRTREIGIRISLGASRTDVLRMVARQAMWQALVGSVIGVTGAFLLSKLMAQMLYGVQPTDPATFGSVAVVLGVVAAIAMLIPARRATRIEPMVALRSE